MFCILVLYGGWDAKYWPSGMFFGAADRLARRSNSFIAAWGSYFAAAASRTPRVSASDSRSWEYADSRNCTPTFFSQPDSTPRTGVTLAAVDIAVLLMMRFIA